MKASHCIVGFLLLLLSCGAPEQREEAPNREDMRFNPAELNVGDSLGELEITSIAVAPMPDSDSVYVGRVAFSGEIEVTGEYRRHPDHPDVDLGCFFADEESATRLPRFEWDDRVAWFCFENQDEATAQLGPPEAQQLAEVVIDEYETVFDFTDTHDTARFIGRID